MVSWSDSLTKGLDVDKKNATNSSGIGSGAGPENRPENRPENGLQSLSAELATHVGPQPTDWRSPMREGVLEIAADPMLTLLQWLKQAKETPVAEPTAMTLATADLKGRPHARTVLFKGTSVGHSGGLGVEFYTNFQSPKSNQLNENPFAALVFHWPQLRRQIRLEGRVERLRPDESEVYFQSRARGSRIGAWSSPQSTKIGSRDLLASLVEETEAKFGDGPIPCPPFWGGWRLLPESIEFWEERPHRLHERRLFERTGEAWADSRLAP